MCAYETKARPTRRQSWMAIPLMAAVCVLISGGGHADAPPGDAGVASVEWDERLKILAPDGTCDQKALRRFLRDSYPEFQLPARRLFRVLDANEDQLLDVDELKELGEVIEQLDSELVDEPEDPGETYVPLRSLTDGIDDALIDGAVYHRHLDALKDMRTVKPVQIESVPATCSLHLSSAESAKATVEDLMQATVIIAGGQGDDYFTSGGVLISSNGLLLTNFHVAEAFELGLTALTSDGRNYRVVEFLAGDRLKDIALLRLYGDEFPFVSVAKTPPKVGDDLVMIHHTENRFYTYDRGYLMRNPWIEGKQWMEVSLKFGPGGSGCGIFNQDHELVGLVSIVMLGDGPSLAKLGHGLGELESEVESEAESLLWDESEDFGADGFELVVRHAVSLPAIRSLFSSKDAP